ncbi:MULTISPECIES: biopolymer transporter ExbD [unclassified Halanaerobium]|uniref:ExbD/TolR family protein n=1 Tax=unclassified Halanaerobium TaxID=2641197 RepID=UPI000DF3FC25|nr:MULTISPECIES: biopolymer transporter ExbD [unclassified Halanaerobium]RCW41156.1 outer membrane transport energization protein ExbD [Halanaerobium sp. MA284_MarDTE_T2]RCW89382.1 outer membrane transport energization protein ExbD [Halanaerobium sp. DL-01]
MKYKPSKKRSGSNLAPMIDIVFLLLIFFLVSSTLQGEEAVYNINLPDSNIGEQQEQQIIKLFLTADNKIIFQNKEFTGEELENFLRNSIQVNKEKTVKIYADKKTDFQYIVSLIENLKESDFNKISFTVREKR